AAAPDPRHRAEVDVPAVLLRAGRDLVEALRVGDELRGVQRLLEVVDELLRISDLEGLLLALEHAAGRLALRGRAGGGAGEGGLGDAGDRDAEIQGGLHGPGAGALLGGLVEDDVDEGLAR